MAERITFKGKFFEIVERDAPSHGANATFEFARRSPGVRLIIPKGDTILLTKEYREELKKYDYRLPGGKVFDSLAEYNTALDAGIQINDAAKAAAIKEAYEEAGIEVTDLSFFHKSICGVTIVWDLFYFVVNSYKDGEQHLEHGEDISVEFFDREKVREMCVDGSIDEERSALTLLRYLSK